MKPSCNGCRVLRKGCNDDCAIRPCLEWIKSPESQGNATLFLAKFYGRTGLLNLITAAPQNQAPAVFRSLLYEACGRVVNPINGSMGLIWTGEWARCEAAVDAVLTGSRINDVPVSDWRAAGTLDFDHILPAGNIRHVARATGLSNVGDRTRFKRTGDVIKPQPRVGSVDSAALWGLGSDSAETVEASLLSQDEPSRAGQTGVNLELSLGFDCQSACDKRGCY